VSGTVSPSLHSLPQVSYHSTNFRLLMVICSRYTVCYVPYRVALRLCTDMVLTLLSTVLTGIVCSSFCSVSDPYRIHLITDPDPIRIQGFDDQKLKKFTAEIIFFLSKTTIYLSLRLHKDSEAREEDLNPQKRTSSTSNHEIY
jgi:hypothetical protein